MENTKEKLVQDVLDNAEELCKFSEESEKDFRFIELCDETLVKLKNSVDALTEYKVKYKL